MWSRGGREHSERIMKQKIRRLPIETGTELFDHGSDTRNPLL
jgi:hypothetical protein